MTRMIIFAAACMLAASAQAAAGDDARTAQQTALKSLEVLSQISGRSQGSQDGVMRRCRAFMDDARAAEKLGAKDMAAKNWERAARGCKADALAACRTQQAVAPKDDCHALPGMPPA